MGIDIRNGYRDLMNHKGHKLELVTYGVEGQEPHNIAIECRDCDEVLLDFDRPKALN